MRAWSHNSLFYIFSSSPCSCLSFIGNQTYLYWLQSKPSVISFCNFNHSIRPPVVRSHALIRLVKPEAPSTTPVNPHPFRLFCLPRTLCQARSAHVGAPNRIRNPTVFACRDGSDGGPLATTQISPQRRQDRVALRSLRVSSGTEDQLQRASMRRLPSPNISGRYFLQRRSMQRKGRESHHQRPR